ncbi:MAG: glucosaminidase domain-containing protein [Sphingobacteriaceae bacterium]|nr:glucosaminidase domain-containing protein [Sphingobacteriaceae bacterium]
MSKSLKSLTLVSIILIILFAKENLHAQPPLFKTPAYVHYFAEIAVQQMVEHKIPASVTLAQAICESNCGTSVLAKRGNNHFGIKCHVGWQGDTILKTDDEINECFRSYASARESYNDHSLFLKNRPRYSFLFNIAINDYKAWCNGLKQAGYATFNGYAEELIRLIEENKLFEIDGYEYLPFKAFKFEQRKIEVKQLENTLTKEIKTENLEWFLQKPMPIRPIENRLLSREKRNDKPVKIKIGVPNELDIVELMDGPHNVQ